MMELLRADQPTLSLRAAMDRLLEQSYTPLVRDRGDAPQHVPANLWEDAHTYYLYLLVPGVDPDSVEITTLGGALTIAGELTAPTPENGKAIWYEWGTTKFRRQFQLPTGFDAERCQASYANGVLSVTVPKPEQAKPKSIKIQAGPAADKELVAGQN